MMRLMKFLTLLVMGYSDTGGNFPVSILPPKV